MNKELAIECIKTQRQFVDDMTREAFDMAIDLIEETFPIADVEPVRHGHWIKHEGRNGEKDSIECSACGVWIDDMPRKTFCPNCGARMDGDE